MMATVELLLLHLTSTMKIRLLRLRTRTIAGTRTPTALTTNTVSRNNHVYQVLVVKLQNVYYLYQGGCPYPDCPSHTQSHEELSPHNDLVDSHNAKEGGGRRSRGPPPYSTNSLKLRGKSLGDNVFLDDGDPNLGCNHESGWTT